jgi:hypothetical protein
MGGGGVPKEFQVCGSYYADWLDADFYDTKSETNYFEHENC